VIRPDEDQSIIVPINLHLFEWVIENITKNAVDAMGNQGTFTIEISEEGEHVIIDLTDTGKGIPKSKYKSIFNPGYTSKKRGWGLGLSLAQRIIKNYHRGKIFVKSSAIDKGTTFRIVLNKKIKKIRHG
jgi:signal transduction histidine kinase